MALLRTVVCDDEHPALAHVSALLEATGAVQIVAACSSPADAIAVINGGGVDLAVFDIEMPGVSGVDAFHTITAEPKPLVIFATAHPEYAVDAFGVDAIDYILKPLDPERVLRAVEKAVRLSSLIALSEEEVQADAQDDTEGSVGDVLTVRDAGRTYFIPYDDVYWIEAAGDYSLLHTVGREYAIRIAIRVLEAQLPSQRFVRVHRSAIVAVSHVREIERLAKGEANLTLSTGAVVKASRSYRDAVQALALATPKE